MNNNFQKEVNSGYHNINKMEKILNNRLVLKMTLIVQKILNSTIDTEKTYLQVNIIWH